MEDALARLEAKRAEEAAVAAAPGREHVGMEARGGKFTMEKFSVAFNEFRAQAETKEGNQWLRRYGMRLLATFTLRKFGEALARVCALYWAEKMSHFHSLWCARGQGSYEYSPEDLASFPEPRAFTEAFEAASLECRKRMSDLRAMVPRKPVG